jgi:hypothetical protein
MVTSNGTDCSVTVINASRPPRLKVRGLYGRAPRLVNASEHEATAATGFIGMSKTPSPKRGRWSPPFLVVLRTRFPIVMGSARSRPDRRVFDDHPWKTVDG